MSNSFYNDFDIKNLPPPRKKDYRTPFQQERDRILHSTAFRRLQAKTQVFWSGEYDFYRTRLTHSIEVSQIGRSICNYIKEKSPIFSDCFYVDQDLVEAICLSHDLGHPPFGHAGERRLNCLMQPYGGFEGNAQTLRIITETFYPEHGKRRGMSPTYALLDGLMKYKTLYCQLSNPKNHFLYDEQKRYLKYIFNKKNIPSKLTPGDVLNDFQSIECQIMDWADDIAFSINDFSDGFRAGFISEKKVGDWYQLKKDSNKLTKAKESTLCEILDMMKSGELELRLSQKIGQFVEGCTVKKRTNFMSEITNRYAFGLTVDSKIQAQKNVFKQLTKELVLKSPGVCQLEHKSNYLLESIFKSLEVNYIKQNSAQSCLLPSEVHDRIIDSQEENERARLICDYIAGMTDRFAIRMYRRLFDPDFGSIADLV